jgi:protein SCO1/2
MTFARSAFPARRWLGLAAAFAALLLAACGSSASSKTITLHGAAIAPPPAKPNVTLTDTSGQPFNLVQQTQGYLTLVYFGYTHCPDVCPAQMAHFGAALKALPANEQKQVKLVFITTDPARDTPSVIRTWLDNFGTNIIGLTGSQQQIDQAQQLAGVGTAAQESDGNGGYGVNHAAFVLAYTKDNLAHEVYPDGVPTDGIKADLAELVQKDVAAVPPAPSAPARPSATP